MPQHHYIPTANPLSDGQIVQLDQDRSTYLCRVLRLRQGDLLNCFDGAGLRFSARLHTANPKAAAIKVQQIAEAIPPASPQVHLGLSLIKGAGQDRAIAAAVELGAHSIQLYSSDRSNVKLDAQRRDNKLAHWHKVIIGAAEQCGRVHLPALYLTSLAELLAAPPVSTVTVLDQQGIAYPATLPVEDRLLLIGPEGGWSETELSLFSRNGYAIWNAGPHTLRAETVPAVALALLFQAHQSQ